MRIGRGDAQSLDELYLLVGKRMFALARGIVQRNEDAEDVVSDSLVKLVRYAASFREENGYAYVMRIVRNTALDFLRKNKREATVDIDALFSLSDDRYSPEKREDAILLERAIRGLSPPEKRMIYYRYYLDYTVREIAREENIGKSTAERAVQAAEEHLKELLHAGQTEGE